MVDKIPGQLSDRRTMLGELNWIFTAITDTIAWSSLPKELFQKLFRLVWFRFFSYRIILILLENFIHNAVSYCVYTYYFSQLFSIVLYSYFSFFPLIYYEFINHDSCCSYSSILL